MTDALGLWLDQHAACPMPILRETQEYFKSQQDVPSVNISRLWRILGKDPGLCLNFLRQAGKSKKSIVTSVHHAMRILGMPRVLSLTEELKLLDEIIDTEIQQLVLAAHARAFHTSFQCLDWAQFLHDSTVEDTATAAIMSELADYLLCCYEPKKSENIHQLKKSSGLTLDEATKQVMGFSQRDLCLKTAIAWSLPEMVIESFRQSPDCDQKIQLVTLASKLCREVEHGWDPVKTEKITETISSVLLKAPDIISRRIHIAAARSARESYGVYKSIIPAAVTMIYRKEIKAPEKNVVNLTSARSSSQILKRELEQIRDNRTTDSHKIMSHAFKAISQGLKLDRVFFAILDKDRQNLLIKYIICNDRNFILKKSGMKLKENKLLLLIMNKPQSLWVNSANRLKYLPLLSLQIRSTLANENFFMMSIFVKDKPVGLFYADRCDHQSLDETRFKYFKLICRETGQALAHISNDGEHKNIVNA